MKRFSRLALVLLAATLLLAPAQALVDTVLAPAAGSAATGSTAASIIPPIAGFGCDFTERKNTADGFDYEVAFEGARDVVTNVESVCPQRIGINGTILANPTMVHHPSNPAQVTIVTQAGARDPGSATDRRQGGRIAVLYSPDEGGTWETALVEPPVAAPVFTERVAATTDDAGRLHVAVLYAHGTGASETMIAVWTLDDVDSAAASVSNGRFPVEPTLFTPWTIEGTIVALDLVHEPRTDTVVMTWSEFGTHPRDAAIGEGPATWARIATLSGNGFGWLLVPERAAMGPCRDVSNAVAANGRIWLACSLEFGYTLLPNMTADDVVVHRFDPRTGAFVVDSASPLSDGRPLLAAGRDDGIALLTQKFDGGMLDASMSDKIPGHNWTRKRMVGMHIMLGYPFDPAAFYPREEMVLESFAYRTSTRTFQYVVSEKRVRTESSVWDSVENPYAKTLVATDVMGLFLHEINVGYGNVTRHALRTGQVVPDAATMLPGLQDSVKIIGARHFVAYEDAGTIAYGELVEHDNRAGPLIVFPASVDSAINTKPPKELSAFILAVGGVLGAGMVVRTMTLRRKSP